MDPFVQMFVQAARSLANEMSSIVIQDGIPLKVETVTLVNEIEEASRQQLIDQSLRKNNREAFMKLTTYPNEAVM